MDSTPNEPQSDVAREELIRRCLVAEEQLKTVEFELRSVPAFKKEIQQLQADNAILRGRIENLTADIQAKNQQIEELFKKWQTGSMSATLRENQELSAKVDARDRQIQKLEAHLRAVQEEMIQKNQQIIDRELARQEKTAEAEKLRKESEHLRQKIDELNNDLTRARGDEIAQFQKGIREREIEHFRSLLKEMRENADKEQLRLESEVRKLEVQAREKTVLAQAMEQELVGVKAELEQRRAHYQEEIRSMQLQLTARDSQIRRLAQESAAASEKQPDFQKLKEQAAMLTEKLNVANAALEKSQKQTAEQVARVALLENELARLRAEPSPASVPPEAEAAAAPGPRRVLVAEPLPETQHLIAQALIKEGYEVLGADNSEQLIQQARAQRPDVILINFALGPLDGHTCCRELSQIPEAAAIPVIIVAGNLAATDIFNQDPMPQVKTFLFKPFSSRELIASVQQAVAPPGGGKH